jgi:ferrous iron transport protein A
LSRGCVNSKMTTGQVGDSEASGRAVCSLCDLSPGESGEIREISGHSDYAALLECYGFVPGALVRAERSAPQGDPKIYRLDGRLVAVRRQDAKGILVVREKQ